MATAFESLLAPVTPHDFRAQYYGERPLLIRGHAKKFADLFTWDDLNAVLNRITFPHPDVRVSLAGDSSRPNTSRSLIEQCRAGATLCMNDVHLHDPKVAQFLRGLEADTAEPFNANLYLSQPGKAGFQVHYDLHDVFIVHLYGYKGWTLYERTLERPTFGIAQRVKEPPAEPLLECELAPGDVLYVPRGTWHHPVAQREMSLHLTVGCNARIGTDFLTWLIKDLREDVRFRHEMPLSFTDETEEEQDERLREYLVKLAEVVSARILNPATVREFRKDCLLNAGNLRRFHLPAQFLETPSSQLPARAFSRPIRHRFMLEDGPTEHDLTLSVRGHVFYFPRQASSVIRFVMREMAFTYDEVLSHAGELTEQGLQEVMDTLLRAGIIEPAGGPEAVPGEAAPRERFAHSTPSNETRLPLQRQA